MGILSATLNSFEPNSPAKTTLSYRQFVLSMYRIAVKYYQPLIEKRTGVQLGNIQVWEYSYLEQHKADEYRNDLGVVRSILKRRVIKRHRDAIKTKHSERAKTCSASYYRNAIYVSFASGTLHEEFLAQCVVHELAHALWYELGGPTYIAQAALSQTDLRKLQILCEGFATFAETVWFRDIYPLHARVDVGYRSWEPNSVYDQGIQRIREIVRDFGPQILMKIPSRWFEF